MKSPPPMWTALRVETICNSTAIARRCSTARTAPVPRFNALRREIGEISQKVLASTLRDLEENGFVTRTVTPVKPPQIEYALTDLGRDLLRPVGALAEWVIDNSARIETARTAYALGRN